MNSGGILKGVGWSSISAGVLALIACELPLVLALLGLGGLSATAAAIRPPAALEWIAISLGAAGMGILIVLALARRRTRSGDS